MPPCTGCVSCPSHPSCAPHRRSAWRGYAAPYPARPVSARWPASAPAFPGRPHHPAVPAAVPSSPGSAGWHGPALPCPGGLRCRARSSPCGISPAAGASSSVPVPPAGTASLAPFPWALPCWVCIRPFFSPVVCPSKLYHLLTHLYISQSLLFRFIETIFFPWTPHLVLYFGPNKDTPLPASTSNM